MVIFVAVWSNEHKQWPYYPGSDTLQGSLDRNNNLRHLAHSLQTWLMVNSSSQQQ